MVRFKILGSLEVVEAERAVPLTAPKIRQVLSLLLVRTGQLVRAESVIQELWGDVPPKSASTTVQTYIYQLRKTVKRENLSPGREMLFTQPFGYQLRVAPEQLDLCLFEKRTAEGRRLLDEGRARDASRRLQEALDLWTGPVLADVTKGPLLNAHAVHLQEQRMRTLEMRIRADMRLGRYRELVGELRSLVATYPLDEWFHGQLIEALHRAGRRAEALDAYHQLRRLLRSELGLDPSPELQRLHQQVLAPVPAGHSARPGTPLAARSLHFANGRSRG